jgi:hypothetical protein
LRVVYLAEKREENLKKNKAELPPKIYTVYKDEEDDLETIILPDEKFSKEETPRDINEEKELNTKGDMSMRLKEIQKEESHDYRISQVSKGEIFGKIAETKNNIAMKPFESPPKKLVFSENITLEKKSLDIKSDKKQALFSDSTESRKGGQTPQNKALVEPQKINNPKIELDKEGSDNLPQSEKKLEKQSSNRETKKIFIPQKLEEIGFDNLKDFLTR